MEPTRPLSVYQCRKCLTIIGDSISLVDRNEELDIVSLSGISNVKHSTNSCTSRAGYDKGSTFSLLNCSKCDTMIGRCYVTTPRKLDRLRDCYSLLSETVLEYELGQVQQGEPVEKIEAVSEESVNQCMEEIDKVFVN
jgi:hypothetical protein